MSDTSKNSDIPYINLAEDACSVEADKTPGETSKRFNENSFQQLPTSRDNSLPKDREMLNHVEPNTSYRQRYEEAVRQASMWKGIAIAFAIVIVLLLVLVHIQLSVGNSREFYMYQDQVSNCKQQMKFINQGDSRNDDS